MTAKSMLDSSQALFDIATGFWSFADKHPAHAILMVLIWTLGTIGGIFAIGFVVGRIKNRIIVDEVINLEDLINEPDTKSGSDETVYQEGV